VAVCVVFVIMLKKSNRVAFWLHVFKVVLAVVSVLVLVCKEYKGGRLRRFSRAVKESKRVAFWVV